jgi:regulator-associated protein of mTOR
VSVCVQNEGEHEIISGSVSGDIRFWDVRVGRRSFKQLEAQNYPMTALVAHNFAPILATGSHNQHIKTFNTSSLEKINVIRYYAGFTGQCIGPTSCLAFHPFKLVLAAGATDSIVAIYKPSTE